MREQTASREHQVASLGIEIVDATKQYGKGVVALKNASISIKPGEFVCLLGPSGCGKSTLLWAIGGLNLLSSGSVRVGNQLVSGPDRRVGMVFQNATLMPWRDLMGNLRLPFEIKGVEPRVYKPRLEWLLRAVGLDKFKGAYPHELSGGMQQRASIIRALALEPSVLLMDEPFSALDAFTRDDLSLLLQKMWLETRATTVFVTHNIAEAIFLADRIFVMSARPGRVTAEFKVSLERPRSLDVIAEPEFGRLLRDIRKIVDIQQAG